MNIPDLFYEVDGPPRAYVELKNPLSPVFRIVYEAVYIFGPNQKACEEKFIELLTLAYQPEDGVKTQMLFWRRRPTWEQPRINSEKGTLSARLWISNFTFRSLVEPNEFDQYRWDL